MKFLMQSFNRYIIHVYRRFLQLHTTPCIFSSSSCIGSFVLHIAPPSPYSKRRVHRPIKIGATASKLAIRVMLCLTLSFFLRFARQTTRECTENMRPCVIRWSVMVVMRKCKDPANKPPPHFCPILACTKGGGV